MTFSELALIQAQNEAKSYRYREYFRAKPTPRNRSVFAPPELQTLYFTSVAYCRMACQVINERIDLDSISAETPQATEFLRETLKLNGGADLVASAHLLAMEYGRSYIVPSGSDREDGIPMLQVVPGMDMVHRVNAYTGEILEALQVFGEYRDRYMYWNLEDGARLTLVKSKSEEYPDATVVHPPDNTYTLNAAYPGMFVKTETATEVPVFPLICRGEPTNTFGRPEAKDIFTLQDSACRIATDQAVASGAMGTPKQFLIGVEESDFMAKDAQGDPIPGTEPSASDQYMSRFVTLADPMAKVAEAAAAQLQNFSTALNTNTRIAAAIMGVPQSVFGVASDSNPASGDSIAQDDKRLVRRAETLTRGFEPGWISLAKYLLQAYGFGDQEVTVRWTDPSLPNLSSRSDAVQKLSTIKDAAGNSVYTWQELRQMLGDSADDIRKAEESRELTNIQKVLAEPDQNQGPANEPGTSPPNGG